MANEFLVESMAPPGTDLDVGGRVEDMPAPVLGRLPPDVVEMGEKRGELEALALSVDTGQPEAVRPTQHRARGDVGLGAA